MRVLITGAGGAIGNRCAAELAARGHEVIATARNPAALDDLDVAMKLALDICDDASIDQVLSQCGELDAIVNNAGVTGSGPMDDYPIERLRQVIETNAIAPLALAQRVFPAWRARGSGVVVNMSSVQGRVSPPLEGAYAASKHALEAISEALHFELTHFGIRIVIIEPGYIAPGMRHSGDHLGIPAYDELREQWAGAVSTLTGPGGRSDPQIVALAVALALEDPATPLRVEVGDDARAVLALRRQLSDAEFERAMRETLGIRW
jgi:NAD(P)-dependent dehydrogenase (short-subunit alcohol dehydrogenase family)